MGNRWGNSGNSVRLYFLGSKSLQIVIAARKLRHLLLTSVLKSRDITFPIKVCLVKAMVFPVVMYGCESWTIKKLNAEELMLLNCGVGEDS